MLRQHSGNGYWRSIFDYSFRELDLILRLIVK